MAEQHETPSATGTISPPAAIRDRRPKPGGAIPRHIQMWLMVGLSLLILGIILFTGSAEPRPHAPVGENAPTPAALIQPERVRSYQDRLAEQEARLQRELAERDSAPLPELPLAHAERSQAAAAVDPFADERRRREYESLFADNVALSRRPADRQTYGERRASADVESANAAATVAGAVPAMPSPQELAAFQQFVAQVHAGTPGAQTPMPTSRDQATSSLVPGESSPGDRVAKSRAPRETGPIASDGPLHRLLEGTVIETVLTNRLDGAFAGPVNCLVTTPVYSHSRQHVLIPSGARVLGTASAVEGWGESRLAVSFHRLVMPDGSAQSLERFQGINQIGETGLKDQVDRHYLRVFGASLAIGALSGLAQYNTRGGFDAYTFGDAYRQSAGASLAASAGRVLDRYLNVLPTVTIREGHRIKIYLTNDLELPTYRHVPTRSSPTKRIDPVRLAATPGGSR